MKTKTPTVNVSPRFSLRLAPALVLAGLMACCPLLTRADTIALSFSTSNSLIGVLGGSGGTAGWAFSLSNPLLLTQLGIFDYGGDGLSQSHLVTVWDSSGAQIVGAQATVPSGTGPETNGFRYVSIAPVLLAVGNYTIGGFYNGSDFAETSASAISTASGVTYGGSRGGDGNAFPSGNLFAKSNSYFGPNFQFTAAPASNGVPDSASTWTLLLLGVTAMFGLRFFLRLSA